MLLGKHVAHILPGAREVELLLFIRGDREQLVRRQAQEVVFLQGVEHRRAEACFISLRQRVAHRREWIEARSVERLLVFG